MRPRSSIRPPLEKSSEGWRPLAELGSYIKPYRIKIGATLVALLIAGVTVLGIVGGLRYVIDQGFVANDPVKLNITLLYLLGAIVVLAAATFWRYALVTWLGERIVADLRLAVYRHIITLSPAFFEVTRTGDVLSRLSSDCSVLQTLIGSSLSVALRNVVLLIGGIVMMLLTSSKLTGLVLLVIPVVVVPIIIFGRRVRDLSREAQERQADVNAGAEETIFGIRTIQAFGHEDVSADDYCTRTEESVRAAEKFIKVRAWLTAMVISFVFTAIGIVLWIGGHDVMAGHITAGQLSAFVGFAVIAASSSGAISEAMGDVHRAAAATERLMAILATQPEIAPPSSPVRLVGPVDELCFDHVSFAYPSRPDVNVLTDIHLTIKRGERVAIVGPSGAGKTTLFQMALRFYDPQQGSVRMNGVDLRLADPRAVRAHMGIVSQESIIFSTDAWRNIGFGRPEASFEAIQEAAKAAHADQFLSALPRGYETHLGEKGVRLSGGQKQRVAIARAILRNPDLLLLDEATSALDAENERLVHDALDHLMQGRTTLIIAHRLATIKSADRIVVMDAGRIVEEGTHETLVRQGGLYARLAQLQFGVDA